MRAVVLTLFLFSCYLSFSQITYTSLENGSWGDKTSVWSVNGKDPCLCSPGIVVGINEEIIIQHRITLVGNIRMVNGGRVEIAPAGFLIGAKYDINIENGNLRNAGLMSISNLNLNNGGVFSSSGGQTFVAQNVTNNGRILLKNGGFYMKNGVLFNATAGGKIELIDQSYLYVENGSIQNRGEILVVSNSCLGAQNGSILNSTLGTMSGDASVIAGRNIENLGFFSSELLWCATGAAVGMPTPMNCESTGSSCFFVFLANDNIEARVEETDLGNEVSWLSSVVREANEWRLEKSIDGRVWELVQQEEMSNEVERSKLIDRQPYQGTYYKLTALNTAEVVLGEWMLYKNRKETTRIYPIPFQEILNIKWLESDMVSKIELLSMDGRVIHTYIPEPYQTEVQLIPAVPKGFYWLKLTGETTQLIKVISF